MTSVAIFVFAILVVLIAVSNIDHDMKALLVSNAVVATLAIIREPRP